MATATATSQGVISRREWEDRYADRLMAQSACGPEFAREAATIGADEYERNEREAGGTVIWWGGGPGASCNTPEEEADEEMSYWDDDGE